MAGDLVLDHQDVDGGAARLRCTLDANRRWPDVLAERLQKDAPRPVEWGVLNQGIIGNRLLNDSPRHAGLPFGAALGEGGLARFERDLLAQPGVKYVIEGLGINDIVFPGSFTPPTERVSAQDVIAGYLELIARAHRAGVRVVGTTIPPFENATFTSPAATFYTPEKEAVRQEVNAWMRSSAAFDAVVDFDSVLRDPSHPTRLLPAYDTWAAEPMASQPKPTGTGAAAGWRSQLDRNFHLCVALAVALVVALGRCRTTRGASATG